VNINLKNKIFSYIKNMALRVAGIDRHQKENIFNYSDEQLDKKKLALMDMKKLYPDVSEYYAELIYDMCVNKTDEELEEIKKSIETTPPKYDGSIPTLEKENK